MYVTYDLPQTEMPGKPQEAVRSAKEFQVPGVVVKWETGEFEIADSGKKTSAIRIEYARKTAGTGRHVEFQIIELPATAQNVRIRDTLPEDYREGLESAA